MKLTLILKTGLFCLLLIPEMAFGLYPFPVFDGSYFQKTEKTFVDSIDPLIKSDTIGLNDPPKSAKKTSLFDAIYQLDGTPKIKITTDARHLINNKFKETYQVAGFELFDPENKKMLNLPGRIKARGNIRKKVSFFPPVKFDFEKPLLDSLGFLKTDKLKFVFPRDSRSGSQDKLYKEFLAYEIYNLLDSNYVRTKLIDISIHTKGKEKYHFTGFMIEEEKEYARRKNAAVVEKGILIASHLDRKCFLKMAFFQYMIANTDWSISNKHNIKMVKLPGFAKVVAIPYDFDYAGFVGQSYAVPYETLPIKNVDERYFYPPYKMKKGEFYLMVDYFLSLEQGIYQVCENATYLDKKSIRECKAYLKEFFDLLRKPERLKSEMVKK
ncbi:MAG: hypothetical protein ACI8P3_000675 [Saprospiraceae bacterium]|jgi:hypothetical protein